MPLMDNLQVPDSPPTHATPSTPLSKIDIITTTIARAFAIARASSQSISPQPLAEDSVLGRASETLKPEGCICRFEPVELSLFDLAMLALVVHKYAPIYSLISTPRQC
jgi:hypothetical protein